MSLGLVSYGSSDEGGESETDEDALKNDDDEFGFDAELSGSLAVKLPPPKFAVNEPPAEESSASSSNVERLQFNDIPKPSARPSLESVVEEPELIIQPSSAELALAERPPIKRKTVQIAALSFPAVDSDSDDEAPSKKKPAKIGLAKDHKTGLFAVLPPVRSSTNVFLPKSLKPPLTIPPPKHSTTTSQSLTSSKPHGVFEPRVLSRSVTMSTAASSRGQKVAETRKINGVIGSNASSDEEDDSPETPDFFSLVKMNDPNPSELAVSDDVNAAEDWLKETMPAQPSKQHRFKQNTDNFTATETTYGYPLAAAAGGMNWEPASGSNNVELYGGAVGYEEGGEDTLNPQKDECFQDEQFLRMQGRRQRGKEIRVVDVTAGEAPSALELVKGMTAEVDRPVSHNSKDGPTSQQRRKHQITYLAHQAKEREFQLKNQWAENKFAKRQAQSKYGF